MLAELNNLSSMIGAPFNKCTVQTGGNLLRHGHRHNPLRTLPSTDDMIAFRLKFGGFSNPQTLSHALPTFDSFPGQSIRAGKSFREYEQLTCVKVTARPEPLTAQLVSRALPRTSPGSLTPDRPDTP